MNEIKNRKYMDAFTTLGYILAFGSILLYSLLSTHYLIPIIGVAMAFVLRMIGYQIDRYLEEKENQ